MATQQNIQHQEASSPKESQSLKTPDPSQPEEVQEHIVEYGSATQLTKGRGGRSSESQYPMP